MKTEKYYIDQFIKSIKLFDRSQDYLKTFQDFCNISALVMHNLPFNADLVSKNESYEIIESKYMEAIKNYSRDKLELFSKMLSLVINYFENYCGDFLGSIFSKLELFNSSLGQFFTPYHVSKLMSEMAIGSSVKESIETKGYVSINDPCSGGGGMLIAASEIIKNMDLDPKSSLFVCATDISKVCFDMSYLQISALGLTGVITHGNSLSLKTYENRKTYQYLVMEEEARKLKPVLSMLKMINEDRKESQNTIDQEIKTMRPEIYNFAKWNSSRGEILYY